MNKLYEKYLGEATDHKSLLSFIAGIKNYVIDISHYITEDDDELFEYVNELKDIIIKMEEKIKGE